MPGGEYSAGAALDALSLHTIAEREDAYATQEQEDADFALALQLEEEESHNLVESQDRAQNQSEDEVGMQDDVSGPYRDDPDAENVQDELPPYRDDPNADPINGEDNIEAQIATTQGRRRHFCISKPRISVQSFDAVGKSLKKLPWCLLTFFVIFLAVVIGGAFLFIHLTRLPPKDRAWRDSQSRNFDLKLPKLYPTLEAGASDECKRGWEKYAASLYCQEQILSPVWDNGDADEVRKAKMDPWAYSEWVCLDACRRSIMSLDTPLMNTCNRRTDRFDIMNYGKDGKMYFEKDRLPEGPIHAQKALIERYDRLCAKPEKQQPQQQPTEWGTCAADLWMKWGVVDGRHEMNLNSLDKFLEATSEKKLIRGGRVTGTVKIVKGEKQYNVYAPQRRVGPGEGETNCGYCTGDWLERKMRSFEYGSMIDPSSGEALGLAEFNDLMTNTIKRCETTGADKVLKRVHEKWTQYGWWCNGKPCHEDRNTTDVVRTLLHGMRKDDWPLPELRKMAKWKQSPKQALNALHDSLLNLPCSIWFNEYDAVRDIIPNSYHVHHLCSDHCRNAIDRVQQQHGAEFAAAATEKPPYNIFQTWDLDREQVDKICLSLSMTAVVHEGTPFCAPGYAALDHPEFIFAQLEPSKPVILAAFSTAVDKLDKKLPRYMPKPGTDVESRRILSRTVSESVCNTCAGELFIGRNPDWKDRVDEFLDDVSIDGKEYTRVAKKYLMTCWRMMGLNLSWQQKKKVWEATGLDRYD